MAHKNKLRILLTMMAAEAARPVIGGQAVIEGVMMRSPKSFAVAVRRPDNSIVVKEEAWLSFAARFPFLRWPLLRGATMLIESMYNGLGALNFSAQEAMAGLEEQERKEKAEAAKQASADAVPDNAVSGETSASAPVKVHDKTEAVEPKKESQLSVVLTLMGSLLFAVLLFKGVPHFLTWGIGELWGGEGANALPVDSPLFHLIDGGIRLAMFVGYILLISRLPDVKRLFMYHGAEHMSVHTYEASEELTVDNTRPKTTAHPRCGTTLILLVIAVSIVVFVAVIPLLPRVSDNDIVQTAFALLIKIPLMLPVAGVAYEFQRAAAKRPDSLLVKLFIAPGMLMQKLTTRQPTDPELEVALTALRKTVWREQQEHDNPAPRRGEATVEVFPAFSEVQKLVA